MVRTIRLRFPAAWHRIKLPKEATNTLDIGDDPEAWLHGLKQRVEWYERAYYGYDAELRGIILESEN